MVLALAVVFHSSGHTLAALNNIAWLVVVVTRRRIQSECNHPLIKKYVAVFVPIMSKLFFYSSSGRIRLRCGTRQIQNFGKVQLETNTTIQHLIIRSILKPSDFSSWMNKKTKFHTISITVNKRTGNVALISLHGYLPPRQYSWLTARYRI